MNDVREDQYPREPRPAVSKGAATEPPVMYAPWMIGGPGVEGGVISLRDIVLIVARGWWIILITLVLGLLAAIYVLAHSAPRYTVTMTISAANRTQTAGPSPGGLLGALSQGFSLQSQRPEYERFKYYLTSRIVAQELQDKHGFLQTLYAGQWDAKSRSWIRQTNTGWQGWVKRAFGIPDWTPPSVDSLADFLESKIKFESTGSVMEDVHINLSDPAMGIRLLRWIYDEAESAVRDSDRVRLDEQIGYVERKLRETAIADQRAAMIGLLSELQRRRSLIHGGAPYAAELIDPPHASAVPTSPNPVRFLTLAIAGSIVLGIIVVFIVEALREQ